MDPDTKKEIDDTVRMYLISKEDIEMDLDTRDNYPGEFLLLPLMHVASADLRAWLGQA